ncbi:MAG: lysophospholipid acyltransferase family protein [Desulfobacteraceae bacterium]|nr:lysophospholipid acyltransferase family protein [Desulfobacteraceae bacterium]
MDSSIDEKTKRRRGIVDYLPFLPALIAVLLRVLHRTCKFTIIGEENLREAQKTGGPVIAAFWHSSFPGVLYYFRDRGYLTITSRSRDGELAARLVNRLGYTAFRGSPGKGGAIALKQLISAFRGSAGGGFPADGSQGPVQVVQKGLIVLGMYTGSPIFAVSVAADRCWRFRSWDRTILAKPFANVVLAVSPSIRVERGASSEMVENYRVRVQEYLDVVTDLAARAAGGRFA